MELALAAVEPGVTRMGDTELTIFRRMWTGESQRGRSDAWTEDTVVQGGDILSAPGQGVYAYVASEREKRNHLRKSSGSGMNTFLSIEFSWRRSGQG